MTDRARRHRSWVIAVVAVAFVLRLAWLLYAKGDPPRDWLQAGDQYSYWYYGNEIAAGRGYIGYVTHTATAYYPIGFPALLAVWFWLTNHTPFTDDLMLSAGLLHVAVSTATVAFVYVIARRLFNATTGLIAAALLAVWPNAIFQVASLQVETMFVFWATAALAVIVTHDWSRGLPSRGRLLAFGVVLGVSVLVRPFSVWFLLGLFLAVLGVGAGWRRAFVLTAIPALVVVAMSIPWTVRNEIRLHALVPTSTNTGDTLCLDRNSTATGGFRFADHDGCVDPNLPEVPRNNGNTRKAISFVIHHPAREALQIVRRGRIEFDADHDGLVATESLGGGPRKDTAKYDALARAADWYFFAMLALSVAGIVLVARRSPRPERRLVLTGFGALFVIPLLLWGNERFHFPLLPFMAVFAGATVAAALDVVRSGHASRRADDLSVVGV